MDWFPGWVIALDGKERVEVGKRCVWYTPVVNQESRKYGTALALRVVGRLPSGEVVLRTEDPECAEAFFPIVDVTMDRHTGKPLKEHMRERTCPFYWVDAKRAQGEADKIRKLGDQIKAAKESAKIKQLELALAETFPYQAGDLCAHEAWDLWGGVAFGEGPA